MTFTDRMDFYERFSNTFNSLVENLMYHFYHLPSQRKLYEKYFPNAKRSFNEMYKSPAVIFLNCHVSSNSPRPYLPNMIEIGGIHVDPPKPLPENLKSFLDSAEHGAILFSMGSIIQAVNWPVEKREAFVKAFGKLKQKVIWKYENETLPNKPENVMISSWIPQRDILAHPNVKLFITHGGLLGTTEALVEGVPTVGIPIFGDQKMNMNLAILKGYGATINYDDITEESVTKILKKMLNNPEPSRTAKKLSQIYNDRPLTPKESVIYWVDYVIRHNGASHLRSSGNDLNYLEFHSIDVFGVLIVSMIILLLIVRRLIRLLLGIVLGSGDDKAYKVKTN